MKKFFFYVRLYCILTSKYIQARMQYRADFVISTFGIILTNAAAVATLSVIFANIPQLAGWSYHEIVFIYAFSLLAQSPLQIFYDHIWQLRTHTNSGTFIKYYFKPLPTLFYYLSEIVDLKGIGQLVFGVAAFIWAAVALQIDWTWERIVLLPLLLVGSSLVFTSLMLIAASAGFWVKNSFSILSFVSGFRDHARYPMEIYNTVFKFVFTWIVPIGFIAFYPSTFFLRPTALDASAFMTPLIGILLYVVALRVWNAGVRTWGGTGS